jgi:hypothetical protein
VIWAILAILGVPLWVIVGGIAYMLLLNRRLRHRKADVPVRVRSASGKRWRRGHALWVGHVFAFRTSPSGWSESLDRIGSATLRELSSREAHQLRRLASPVIAVLNTDGRTIEVATDGTRAEMLLGPFGERGASGLPEQSALTGRPPTASSPDVA